MERVADVGLEDGDVRAPLGGFFDDLDKPDATLAVALARVVAMCAENTCAISATELAVAIAVCDASGADAAVYSDRVRGRGSRTPGGIAALQMYTLEFRGTSVFEALNEALRSKLRSKCAPFRRYIWMLMHAMREAPAFEGPTVYRGVREDLRSTYKKGRTVTWHGLSSCTSSLEVLQSEQFCGASGQRTICIIALTQGRARWIADVSMVETEDEVVTKLLYAIKTGETVAPHYRCLTQILAGACLNSHAPMAFDPHDLAADGHAREYVSYTALCCS